MTAIACGVEEAKRPATHNLLVGFGYQLSTILHAVGQRLDRCSMKRCLAENGDLAYFFLYI